MSSQQPLEGIRVIESGRFAAGPACATVLADWGADVIKLEPPGGDPARGPGSVGTGRVANPRFELHNRSRRSIAIDALTPDGQRVARQLVGAADVFVTNLRPAALSRLGLEPTSVREEFPRLVYAQVNGYGVGTLAADDASFDHGAFWAYSGMAATFTPGDGIPPQPAGGAGDRTAGALLAGAVGAALFARERTGVGAFVSVSLLATGIWMLGSDMSDALATGSSKREADRRHPAIPTLNCFRSSDGRWFWLQLMLPERQWTAFLDAVDSPLLEEDPRFRRGDARLLASANSSLVEVLDEIFRSRPLAEWESRFRSRGIPFAVVQSVDEVVADPVAWESGGFREFKDADGDRLVVASPIAFDGDLAGSITRAPQLGEHTDEILAEIGLSGDEIRKLQQLGVIGPRQPTARAS